MRLFTGFGATMLFLLACVTAAPAVFAADDPFEDAVLAQPADYAFAIMRKGRKIGEHTIGFAHTPDGLKVTIDITIRVKFGPITVYDYEHRNEELWRDGRLVAIETRTDANGKDYAVSGVATPEGFRVTGYEGELLLPADIMPTSYWQQDFIQSTMLLDTQRGTQMDVTITAGGFDDTVQANKFVVAGDLELDLWYGDGRLRTLRFENRDVPITYDPIEVKG